MPCRAKGELLEHGVGRPVTVREIDHEAGGVEASTWKPSRTGFSQRSVDLAVRDLLRFS
jgi:hypothetical protein